MCCTCPCSYFSVSPDFADDIPAQIVSDDFTVLSFSGEHHRRHLTPVFVIYYHVFLGDFLLLLEYLIDRTWCLRLLRLRVSAFARSTTGFCILLLLLRLLFLLLVFILRPKRSLRTEFKFRFRQFVENLQYAGAKISTATVRNIVVLVTGKHWDI